MRLFFKKNNLVRGMDELLNLTEIAVVLILHNFLEQWKKVQNLAFQRKLILVREAEQS